MRPFGLYLWESSFLNPVIYNKILSKLGTDACHFAFPKVFMRFYPILLFLHATSIFMQLKKYLNYNILKVTNEVNKVT